MAGSGGHTRAGKGPAEGLGLNRMDYLTQATQSSEPCFHGVTLCRDARPQPHHVPESAENVQDMDSNLCSEDPWLVLHKVDSPTKMRYIGTRLTECNETSYDPTRIAPSIQPFVLPQGEPVPVQHCAGSGGAAGPGVGTSS